MRSEKKKEKARLGPVVFFLGSAISGLFSRLHFNAFILQTVIARGGSWFQISPSSEFFVMRFFFRKRPAARFFFSRFEFF